MGQAHKEQNMTDEQIIKRYRKREKVMGAWMAERGYDSWDIFIGKNKWKTLTAVAKKPIEVMLENERCTNIDWSTVRAKKLT